MLVNDNEAARTSAQAYYQLLAEAAKQHVLDEDPATVNRVRSIAQPLIAQATALRPETRLWQWEVHVLKSDQVNAWCMASGKIAVYTGLIEKSGRQTTNWRRSWGMKSRMRCSPIRRKRCRAFSSKNSG